MDGAVGVFRLTLSALQTLFNLNDLSSGSSLRDRDSVSRIGALNSRPSRRSSALSSLPSNAALWAAIAASPMKSISFGIAVSAVSLSASIMSVMPVISVIFGRRGIFGFTRIDSVSTSVPPVIFTAPISITRSFSVSSPVDSKSSTTMVSSIERSSSSVTTCVSSIR